MKIGHVIVPAGDLDAQIAFYTSMGLTVRFRDGDRYAAVTDGSVTLGLADESQQPVPGATALSFQVDDLEASVVALVAAGGKAGETTTGPHERRTVVTDPSGNPIVVYERLSS